MKPAAVWVAAVGLFVLGLALCAIHGTMLLPGVALVAAIFGYNLWLKKLSHRRPAGDGGLPRPQHPAWCSPHACRRTHLCDYNPRLARSLPRLVTTVYIFAVASVRPSRDRRPPHPSLSRSVDSRPAFSPGRILPRLAQRSRHHRRTRAHRALAGQPQLRQALLRQLQQRTIPFQISRFPDYSPFPVPQKKATHRPMRRPRLGVRLQPAADPRIPEVAPVFPALTCTAQASFRTAAARSSTASSPTAFSFGPEQGALLGASAALVQGPRIWESFRARGGSVGMMFWQQSLGEEVDLVAHARADPQAQRRHDPGLLHAAARTRRAA